jgi:MFS family permease
MAEGWLALELTNSAFLVGLVATVSSIPILLFTMPAGAIVDRSDKLRIVRTAQIAFLVQASSLWLLTATHRMTIDWLLILAFLGGLIASIEIPARQAMMIDLVGRDDLPDAIALNSSGFNLARIVGPAVAAVGNRISRTRLLTVVSMLWPALLLTFSLTSVPSVGYALLFAIGIVMILNGAIANGLLQGLVPNELRGRVMAAYGLVVVGLAQVVGAFTGGVVAHAIGVAGAIFITSLLMAAYGVWAFLRRPELRELRERTV